MSSKEMKSNVNVFGLWVVSRVLGQGNAALVIFVHDD